MNIRFARNFSIFLPAFLVMSFGVLGLQIVKAAGNTYYVDQSVVGGAQNGSSWNNAFDSLQDALDVAAVGDEIWVASGVYKPTSQEEDGISRTETFTLIEGVAVYGGFAGDENSLSERDWETNQTILSGDIDSNDTLSGGISLSYTDINGSNAYNVVSGNPSITYTVATILDGFVITGGQTEVKGGDSSKKHTEGGGLAFQDNASPTLRNLWVVGNIAPDDDGAGIHFKDNSSPVLENVTVENNYAGDHGGGIFFEDNNNPTFKNVSLIKNQGNKTASLYLHTQNSATLVNVNFCGNFNSNSSNSKLGAGLSLESNNTVVVINGVFAANVITQNGGGIRMNANNDIDLYQVSISGNQAVDGGGIYLGGSGNNLDVFNSIIWGNSNEITSDGSNTISVSSSIVSDSSTPYSGTNNIASIESPFAEDPSNGNDSTWGSYDDNCGDLRLLQASVAVNVGDENYIPADILDLDNDDDSAEDLPLDLDNDDRVFDTAVDLGAYEITDGPLSQSIMFDLPSTVENGMVEGEVEALSASSSSGLPVSFASSTPSKCTISGNNVTAVDDGTCIIAAQQLGDGVYGPATDVVKSFQITDPTKTDQSITLTSPTNGASIFLDDVTSLIATSTSGLTVSFESKTPANCTVSGGTLSANGIGVCTVEATQVGNATYNPAPIVTHSYSIVKKEQTITFNSLPNSVAADIEVNLAATASSGLPVEFSSDTPTVCTVSGSVVTNLVAGTCGIRASQPGDDEFAAADDQTRAYSVTKLNQSIAFSTPVNGSESLENSNVPLVATADSGLTVSFSSTTPSVCSVTGSTARTLSVGTCRLVATQAGNDRFNEAPSITHTITVLPSGKSSQSISFSSPEDGSEYDIGLVVQLNASSTSGLSVKFESQTSSICNITGSILITVSNGACEIRAYQDGNDVYDSAADVIKVIYVKKDQILNFPSPPTAVGAKVGETVILTASADSGLAVTYVSLSPSICGINGDKAQLYRVGVCNIEARQLGNDGWYPATPVTNSFVVDGLSEYVTYLPLLLR